MPIFQLSSIATKDNALPYFIFDIKIKNTLEIKTI